MPSLYLWCDASPQFRGLEMFAASVDLFADMFYKRWLMPVVSLPRDALDAQGKTIALLWQILLLVGVSKTDIRSFLRRVRSITTDQGTERLIVSMPDFVPDFLEFVGMPAARPEHGQQGWLFPRAIHMPGWKHLWDLMLRRALSSQRWFPVWLDHLKAMISWLRSRHNMEKLCKNWTRRGFVGLVSLAENTSLPTFAEWRWSTLTRCCRQLRKVFPGLASHFDPTIFGQQQDPVRFRKLCYALVNPEWALQFRFVEWLSEILGSLLEWGGGCDCPHHEEQVRQGIPVECREKGRRLPTAYTHAKNVLDGALREANLWTASDWGNNELWISFQGCIRGAHALGMQKILFLDRVPYLLARLREPGIKRRCLEQWGATAPENHHRVTREFLDAAHPSGLWSHVADINEDASNISPMLGHEIESLARIPLDDAVGESPHARGKDISMRARGSDFPWVAASMRIDQNLEDIHTVGMSLDSIDLQREWDNRAAVIQRPKYQSRPRRVSNAELLRKVYKLSHFGIVGPMAVHGGGPHSGRVRKGPHGENVVLVIYSASDNRPYRIDDQA